MVFLLHLPQNPADVIDFLDTGSNLTSGHDECSGCYDVLPSAPFRSEELSS